MITLRIRIIIGAISILFPVILFKKEPLQKHFHTYRFFFSIKRPNLIIIYQNFKNFHYNPIKEVLPLQEKFQNVLEKISQEQKLF